MRLPLAIERGDYDRGLGKTHQRSDGCTGLPPKSQNRELPERPGPGEERMRATSSIRERGYCDRGLMGEWATSKN